MYKSQFDTKQKVTSELIIDSYIKYLEDIKRCIMSNTNMKDEAKRELQRIVYWHRRRVQNLVEQLLYNVTVQE